jgi:thiamine transport system substrate-binding protein
MKRVHTVCVAAVAIALLAAACGGDDSTPAAPTTAPGSTTPKIKKVTLLTHDSFAASEEVLAEFTTRTGYELEVLRQGDAGQVLNQAILRKDRPIADALFGVDNTFLTRALDAEIFEPYPPAGVDQLRPGVLTDPDHRVTPVDQGDVCLNIDRSWFGRDGRPPAPDSLDALIDPRYENLTVVENAATSSPGLAFVLATVAAYGEDGWQDYWRALRDNGVRVVNDWTEAYQGDFTAGGGNGDRPIVVSYGSSPPADVVYSEPKRDEPRIGVVESSCFRQYEFVGVLRGARNPEGARALVDFFLSRTFQEDMPLQMFVNPVVTGAKLPEVYEKWAVVPERPYTLDPQTIGARRDEWIKEWTDLVVR